MELRPREEGGADREEGQGGCLVRVLLALPRRGVPEAGDGVYEATLDDISAFRDAPRDQRWQGVPAGTDDRRLIGFVTSGAPAGISQAQATACCQASAVWRARGRQLCDGCHEGDDGRVLALVHCHSSKEGAFLRPVLLRICVETSEHGDRAWWY